MIAKSIIAVLPLVGYVRAHGSFWHESMFGFNVTDTNSPQYGGRDNRPQSPLKGLPFNQWWMHGHLDKPPHPDSVFEFPAGGTATAELACDKDATSWWPSGPGGNRQNGNDPCPGSPSRMIHTNGINDLGGCAMAIAYKSDVKDVKPEDLVVFSVNHQCIWTRYTDFKGKSGYPRGRAHVADSFVVPAKMPPCPNGKCICAWLWQHQPDAGGDEMYMNGFQCRITGATSNTPVPKGKVPVDCTNDRSKCVKGAKLPMYWDQAEGNNMFNDIYHPPMYLDGFGFPDGAQNDLWDGVPDAGSVAKGSSAVPTSTSAHVAAAASSTVAVQTSTHNAPSTPPASPSPTPKPQQAQSEGSTAAHPTTKGGKGHRLCRPKKTKKSSRATYEGALQKHRRSHRVF
ncbi:hypothetical protein FRC07_000807 [Ceratobasidium sp. 392]|nr:hypothetical protein FRC07_000807 [Ceratobasidium sp. 392]